MLSDGFVRLSAGWIDALTRCSGLVDVTRARRRRAPCVTSGHKSFTRGCPQSLPLLSTPLAVGPPPFSAPVIMAATELAIASDALEGLRSCLSLRGSALRPSDGAAYDSARQPWNALFSGLPPLIIQCASTADVVAAVNFVRESGYPFTVAGGKHSRHSVKSDHVMIHLGGMRAVQVDTKRRRAKVQGGARNGDVDHESALYGLYTVNGTNPDTGVGGLFSGGGIGYPTRLLGTASDQVLEVEMVLADGRVVTANEEENSELLWAARGAAFNFGIVTCFTVALSELGHVNSGERTDSQLQLLAEHKLSAHCNSLQGQVLSIVLIYPLSLAPQVYAGVNRMLLQHEQAGKRATLDLGATPCAILAHGPDGSSVIVYNLSYVGSDIFFGLTLVNESIQAIGAKPLKSIVQPMSYFAMQKSLEHTQQPGLWYERSVLLRDLNPEVAALMVDHFQRLPTGCTGTHVGAIGYGGDSTANRLVGRGCWSPQARQANYWVSIITGFTPECEQAAVQWCSDLRTALEPFVAVVNANSVNNADSARKVYGDSFERLSQLKAQWDPTNLFRNNINIEPSLS